MAKKARAGSSALDLAIAAFFILIAACAVSIALRVGRRAAGRPKQPIRIVLLNGSGRA